MLLLFMLPLPLRPTSALLCLPYVLGYWPLWTMSHGLRSKSLTFRWVCQWEELKDTLWDVYFLYSFTHWMRSIFTHPVGWYAFELWCWRRLLRVPWTARRSKLSFLKEVSPGCSWKVWCWRWNSNTLATWCEELTHWKRLWCWERLRAGGKGDNRGWAGWMASPTQWTWVCVGSRSWCWTGRPGVLQPMGSQRVRHNWATELNWTDGMISLSWLNLF